MLLNAKMLTGLQGASYLFVVAGIAALFGILWRFFYNQTYHNNAHGIYNRINQISCHLQIVVYWIYVVLSIASFLWALVAGFNYLEIVNSPPKLAATKSIILPTQKIAPKQNTQNTLTEPTPVPSQQNTNTKKN